MTSDWIELPNLKEIKSRQSKMEPGTGPALASLLGSSGGGGFTVLLYLE